ncbi:MAG: GlsB/YeaQ/YmgE family stress response membrane protein [Amaricoccus sp.]|uniref:GlsB/YeaQ/YmgE family stress response membrane protein n=1 Tax=Amaricoccus sp. TaxID=1872485 RepID=UPI003314D03A
MENTAAQGSSVLTALAIWIIVGGVAGWLASVIVEGGGVGLVDNVVLGMIGAIVAAMVGAILLLLLVRLTRRA